MYTTDNEKSSKANYLKHCGTITKGRDNNKKGFTAENKYTNLDKQVLPGTKISL